jgi:hypothetical protein
MFVDFTHIDINVSDFTLNSLGTFCITGREQIVVIYLSFVLFWVICLWTARCSDRCY